MHTARGDGVAGIKRRRRDLSSDGVRNLAMTSGRGRLKEDLESSTWRRRQDFKATPNISELPRKEHVRERTRLRLFQFSLCDQASNWLLERLPAGSITTWEDLTTRFLAQFFHREGFKTPQRYPDVPTTSRRIPLRSMDSFQGSYSKSLLIFGHRSWASSPTLFMTMSLPSQDETIDQSGRWKLR
ncbi:zinc finger, CCHC-type containing protein [Tanacetum coccineum]